MLQIRIKYDCPCHHIDAVVNTVCDNSDPETLFEAALFYHPAIMDSLAETCFVVEEIVDHGACEKEHNVLMCGSLLITPIRDMGEAVMEINRRMVEYVYLYDENVLFERPITRGMSRCRIHPIFDTLDCCL